MISVATTAETAVVPAPGPGLRARLQIGIAWNLTAAVFTQGSTFAINIVVANILGREIFGEYAMIRSTVLTLAALGPLATGYTAARYVAEFRSTDQDRAGRILGLCGVVASVAACVAALGLLAGAPWLAADVLRAAHLADGLRLVSIVVLFSVMGGYQVGALAGLEGYRALAMAGMISGTVALVVCSLGAWAGGLTGALGGLSLGAAIQWITMRWLLASEIARQKIVVRYRALRREGAIMLKFALPAALHGLVSSPALWLAGAFLVRQPGGYEQMALYGAATNFRMLVLFLPQIINNVGMSLLNNQRGLSDEARYRKVFWANLGLTAGTVVVGALAVVLVGPWLLLVFGRGFAEGYPVLVVLMLSTIPEGLAVATFQVVQAQERMWLSLLAVSIPRDCVIMGAAYLLAPHQGAIGLAWAHALGWLLALLMIIVLVGRLGLGARPIERDRQGVA